MNFRYIVALVLGLLLVGYYEAIRLFIAELARKKDPTRAENILSYPFAERNLTSYTGPDFTHKLGVYVPSVVDTDEYLVQNQWTTC